MLGRRAFLKGVTNSAKKAVTGGLAFGAIGSIAERVLEVPGNWWFGTRSEQELEATDPHGELPAERRQEFYSEEGWSDWGRKLAFWGGIGAGANYFHNLGSVASEHDELAYVLSAADSSKGALKVRSISHDGRLSIELCDESWFRALREESRIRKILVRSFGFEDLFGRGMDDFLGASLGPVMSSTEKQSILNYLNNLKTPSGNNQRQQELYDNPKVKKLIEDIIDQGEQVLRSSVVDISRDSILNLIKNLIRESGLKRRDLLTIFYVDNLPSDLQGDNYAKKLASDIYSFIRDDLDS